MTASAPLLARRIATTLAEAVRAGDLEAGAHLRAQKLADEFGVSRSPVRVALNVLREEGLLEHRPNRGYFVRAGPVVPAQGAARGLDAPFDPPTAYHRIAEDWLADRIPGDVTEQMLRQRYGLSRAELGEVLLRATREGWAERKSGYGWRLIGVAKTPAAFEQIYRLRMVIEPAAMLEPTYRIDHAVIAEQRQAQQRMLDSDIESLPGERLLDAGARFHEEIVKFSGNPFFHQTLERVNKMRRLLEYRSRVDRSRLVTQCEEHLAMLDLLEAGEVSEASYAMRRHLGGALASKSPILHNAVGQDTHPPD